VSNIIINTCVVNKILLLNQVEVKVEPLSLCWLCYLSRASFFRRGLLIYDARTKYDFVCLTEINNSHTQTLSLSLQCSQAH